MVAYIGMDGERSFVYFVAIKRNRLMKLIRMRIPMMKFSEHKELMSEFPGLMRIFFQNFKVSGYRLNSIAKIIRIESNTTIDMRVLNIMNLNLDPSFDFPFGSEGPTKTTVMLHTAISRESLKQNFNL